MHSEKLILFPSLFFFQFMKRITLFFKLKFVGVTAWFVALITF